jgi:hypothetical protein
MADRRRGDAELLGSLLEAEVPRRGFEGSQLAERRQFPHAEIVDELNSALNEFFNFALRKELLHDRQANSARGVL